MPQVRVIASPLVVGNGLFGNTALYVDEGLAELTLIEEVNALDGARHNFDEDPLYKDRAAQDYHLSFGTVLGFESAIRYLANDSDPGLGLLWTQPGFDASNWNSGHYGVGFDTGPPPNASALLLSKVSLAAVSVFSRLTFPVEDLTRINHLTLGADFDDGFVVWLNGVEVFRSASVGGTAGLEYRGG